MYIQYLAQIDKSLNSRHVAMAEAARTRFNELEAAIVAGIEPFETVAALKKERDDRLVVKPLMDALVVERELVGQIQAAINIASPILLEVARPFTLDDASEGEASDYGDIDDIDDSSGGCGGGLLNCCRSSSAKAKQKRWEALQTKEEWSAWAEEWSPKLVAFRDYDVELKGPSKLVPLFDRELLF